MQAPEIGKTKARERGPLSLVCDRNDRAVVGSPGTPAPF
jgi:hypothetical protein